MKLDDLAYLDVSIDKEYDQLKETISDDLDIDDMSLDSESLKTPRLYSKYLFTYTESLNKLRKIQDIQSKVKLERWRYYVGKQSTLYYKEHGQVHDKILKSDVDMYMNADDYVISITAIFDKQKRLCDLLEKTLKEINQRSYHIKSVIEWRKFESGV